MVVGQITAAEGEILAIHEYEPSKAVGTDGHTSEATPLAGRLICITGGCMMCRQRFKFLAACIETLIRMPHCTTRTHLERLFAFSHFVISNHFRVALGRMSCMPADAEYVISPTLLLVFTFGSNIAHFNLFALAVDPVHNQCLIGEVDELDP